MVSLETSGTVDLQEVGLDLPGRETLGVKPDDRLRRTCRAGGRAWADPERSNSPARSRGTSISTGPTSVLTVLGVVPLREFPLPRPAGSPDSYPSARSSRLGWAASRRSGHLGEKTVRPDQAESVLAGLRDRRSARRARVLGCRPTSSRRAGSVEPKLRLAPVLAMSDSFLTPSPLARDFRTTSLTQNS